MSGVTAGAAPNSLLSPFHQKNAAKSAVLIVKFEYSGGIQIRLRLIGVDKRFVACAGPLRFFKIKMRDAHSAAGPVFDLQMLLFGVPIDQGMSGLPSHQNVAIFGSDGILL